MADISFDHDELRNIAYGIKDDLLQELKDDVTDQIENEISYAKSDILDDVDYKISTGVDIDYEPVLDQVNNALENDCCSKIDYFINGIINCIATRKADFFKALSHNMLKDVEEYKELGQNKQNKINELQEEILRLKKLALCDAKDCPSPNNPDACTKGEDCARKDNHA
tara:strand:+ start:184 stop:687 length:504 start_codon:yes stop_codon:yes gene_type:complete